jgi:hypothetical protein
MNVQHVGYSRSLQLLEVLGSMEWTELCHEHISAIRYDAVHHCVLGES